MRRKKAHLLPRRFLLAILALGILTAAWSSTRPGAIRYQRTRVEGVALEVVRVDLAHARVGAAVAQGPLGELEGFRSFIKRTRPVAAINGTYFGTDGRPIGDLVIGGKLIASGGHRTGLCITQSGRAEVRTRARGARPSWKGYRTVMCAGPRLLKNGKISLSPTTEGFTQRALLVSALRTAVGITRDQQLILVNTRREISLNTLARIMQELGAWDAVNFDGGASTALYYRGRVINEPAGRLSNILLVYE